MEQETASPPNVGALPAALVSDGDTGDESDWEYEYDEHETEDFFITLDLDTHVSARKQGRKKPSQQQTPLQTSKEQTTPQAGPQEVTHGPTNQGAENDSSQAADDDTFKINDLSLSAQEDRIQILDLHSNNPIVSYRNQVYSCYWASTIGTDLLFRPKLSDSSDSPPASSPPLRSYPNFDLVAASTTRLVAKPVKLVPRKTTQTPPANPERLHGSSSHSAIDLDPEPRVGDSDPPGAQPTFLARLAAIKAARGEMDEVPLHPMAPSQQPLPSSQTDAPSPAQKPTVAAGPVADVEMQGVQIVEAVGDSMD